MKCENENMTSTFDKEQTYSFISILKENSTPDLFFLTEEMPLHPRQRIASSSSLKKCLFILTEEMPLHPRGRNES